jgi:hypothetical protein
MATPRDILNSNKPDSSYFLSKDLVGDPITILPEMKELESDYTESGKRLHVQVRLEDGTEVTWQPSEGLANNEIKVLSEHDGLPVTCKIATYATKWGEGYRLLFEGEDGY